MTVEPRAADLRELRGNHRIVVGAVALSALLGPLVAFAGARGLMLASALGLFGAIAIRPRIGAYLYLAATPLIVGLPRGELIPLLRPNEALVALILAALVARALLQIARGEPFRPRWQRMDLALVLLAGCSSVVPLLLRFGRGLPVSGDDVLYALVLWKYWLTYRLVRAAVATPAEVACCLWLSMAAAVVVALVAILQVLDLAGVPGLLASYYDNPFTGITGPAGGRGSSTVASSFGVADLMAMNLAIALAWLPDRQCYRPLLLAGAAAFVAGCIASGQVSGLIGLLVAVLALGLVTGRLIRVLTVILPAAGIAALVFWPVIAERLRGFEGPAGLPQSWVGRIDNIERFVWPELSSGLNWALGVRPSARLPAPEPWREWVFIESGYLWLLWTGGLPLLAAFLLFVRQALRDLGAVIRARADPVGVAACAAFAGLASLVILMLLDPHLTMRGGADLFFPLLALAAVEGRRAGAEP